MKLILTDWGTLNQTEPLAQAAAISRSPMPWPNAPIAPRMLAWESVDTRVEPGMAKPSPLGDPIADLNFSPEDLLESPNPATDLPPVPPKVMNLPAAPRQLPKAKKASLQKILSGLHEVRGYRSALLMTATGEVIARDDINLHEDPWPGGASINQIQLYIHSWSKEVGLQGANEVVVREPTHVFVLMCSGLEMSTHFHFVVMLDVVSGDGLMRIFMRRMIPELAAELAQLDV